MEDLYDTILRQFPPSTINNSRQLILRLLNKFLVRPSDTLKSQLESVIEGISIDHSDFDWGNGAAGEHVR